jgi:hypothetical protein
MGLDMYLRGKRYYWYDETKPTVADVPAGFEVKEITVECAYWRKDNHIHQWFVANAQNNVDDCGDYPVERAQLVKLVDICKQVVADPSKGATLLPTQGGFFFGSTEYDQYYIEGCTSTIAQLEKVLAAFPAPPEGKREPWEFIYHSSW